MSPRHWLVYFYTGTIITMLAVVTACMPDIGDSDAALALEDIVSGENTSRLKLRTEAPTKKVIEYAIDGRKHIADLYLSPKGALAAIVLVPGVVADGKDDRRLVALANTLARLRFAVLIPEIAGLRRFHTRASDVRVMADAFRYLIAQPTLAPSGRAGFVGFSYGAGMVLLAGLEDDIREQVQFVLGFGGFYDIQNIITYFTTGYYRDEVTSRLKYRFPHYYLKWVFTRSNADLLQHPIDRKRMYAVADTDDESELEADLAKLAPDARALYQLISNDKPARVPELMKALPEKIRHELEGMNPASRDLSQLRAQIILLHGRGDTMIPYTESIAIAQALPAEQVKLFIIEGYAHTNVKPKRGDLPQILEAMQLLLEQRADTN